jgi:hypothetical protein
MQGRSALLPFTRSWPAATLALVWLLTPVPLRGANPDELELTLEVTANGAGNIAHAIEDQCEMQFTARLVFAPDPKTGRYGDPVQETYTMTASGSGHVLDIESWTYSAVQPTPGTVSLNYYPDEGRATIGWGYLDHFIRSEPEGGQGSERLARTAIKLADDDITQQPDAGEVRFKPNAASFTATGSTRGQYQDILGHGEMSATFTLTRGGERVEAVILRPRGYESWEPMGGSDQSLPGTNHLVVTAVLRMPGTSAPPPVRKARFRFELMDGSKEPGLCLNAPSRAEAHQHYDLQFAAAGTVDPSANRVRHVTEDLSTEASVVVFCYDYGAFAQLRVTAITDTGEEIPAHVEGEPDTPTLRLPEDANDNRVADVWERAQGTWGKIQDPAWDGADEPNDHEVQGDGISLYERYRGFRFGQTHERLAARRKHVFVYDPDGLVHCNLDSVMSFAAASGLEVRFVEDETWTGPGAAGRAKRVVNFNTSGFGHAVDQHALHVRLVCSQTPALAGDFQAMWRAKYGKKLNRDISSYYGFTYHDVTGGKWAEAPRSAFAIELYPWGIDRISRLFVRYHTSGLSQFANYDAEPADEQARLLTELDQLTDDHIRENPDDWEEQNYLYLLAGTSHELGHGVGIDDLVPPHNGGPWSCYMRYLAGDFPPDPLDRMELDARWRHPTHRPQEFCRSPVATVPGKGCYHQIHVTDRPGARRPAQTALAAAAASASDRAGFAPDAGAARARPAASGVRLPAAFPAGDTAPLRVEAVLGWDAPLAGDPLWITVRLASPGAMEAWTQALAEGRPGPGPAAFPTIAREWPAGIRLELSRVAADGSRTTVLGAGPWDTFRRAVAPDASAWEERLGTRTREFLTDPAALPLPAGEYGLVVAWDGRGLAETTVLPAGGIVTGKELRFTVGEATDAPAQASHLRRLAYQAWDTGRDEQARQWGSEALGLNPTDGSREALDTVLVVAAAKLRLNDSFGAAQTLEVLGRQAAADELHEVQAQAGHLLNALAPSVHLVRGGGLDRAPRLEVLGHPGQEYEVRVSSDLRSWLPLDRRVALAHRYEVEDAAALASPTGRYYQVLWLPPAP